MAVASKIKSKVYFQPFNQSDDTQTGLAKLAHLLDESKVLACVHPDSQAVLKMHFGEEGNTGFIRPEYVRVVTAAITQRQAQAIICDTNTLYQGKRSNSRDHLKLAFEHGFTPQALGASVTIPQDDKEEDVFRAQINQKFIKQAKIARIFYQADALLSLAHFKGHMLSGFGGALKNIAMGCATREGKLEQHCDVAPLIIPENCRGCSACCKVCAPGAISIRNEVAVLDNAKCIGCASCIAACKYNAIEFAWEAGADVLQNKMVEYAWAVLRPKQGKCGFINFALKITKECDCLAKDDPRIAPDIGIFASSDPVSIDKASMDLVNLSCGRDIFRKVHPNRNGNIQLEYAAAIGLGNLDYELITL